MALDATRLAGAIADALDASGAYDDALDPAAAKTESEALLEDIATELILEFENNGVVNTTVASGIAVTVDPNTGVGSTTETGSGTGSIT